MNLVNFNHDKSRAKALMVSGLLSLSGVTTGIYATQLNAAPLSTSEINSAEQPNIIYILADDMGQGDSTVYNANSKIATPNLERLAQEGMTFSNVHTSSSVCTPTRYGIITGRYSWRTSMKNGVLGGYSRHLIDPKRETVPSLLKKNGYATAMIGKWHLGMDMASTDGKEIKGHDGKNADLSQPIKNGPNTNGFDYYFGIAASLNHSPHAFIENDRVQGEMVYLGDNKTKKRAGIDGKLGWAAKGWRQDNVQNTFIDKTIAWIDDHKKSGSTKPFFIYLPLNSPHSPLAPSEKFIGKSGLSPHGDFTMEMDYEIGRLLNKLDEMKLSDNTLVIFTADNGTSPKAKLEPMQAQGHFSSMDYRGLKGSLFEGGHRVPFIARWPGKIKAKSASDFHASTVDLMATIADITGAKLADNVAEDSVSMKAVLLGQATDSSKRGIIYHSDAGYYSIRQGDWKLILHEGGGTRRNNPKDQNNPVKNASNLQLFNMVDDPTERVNVQAKHPERVSGLVRLLAQHVKRGRSTEGEVQSNDAVSDKVNRKWLQKVKPKGSSS